MADSFKDTKGKDTKGKDTKGKDTKDAKDIKKSLSDMPAEVLIQIGLALPCRDFGRFLQTNRSIHSCLDSHYVWHQRFTTRFGQAILKDKLNPPLSNNDPSKLTPSSAHPSPRFPSSSSQIFHSSSNNNSNNNSANTSPTLQQQQQFDDQVDPVSAAPSPLPSPASSPRMTPSTAPLMPSDSSSDDGNGGEGSSSSRAKRPPKVKPRRIDLRKTNMVSKEMLIDMYKQLSRMTLPAEDMMIAHMGNQFWRMITSTESKYGKLAELASVWWMDVVAVFVGVPPGRYKVQWRLKVTSDAPVVNTEFRAVLFDKHEDQSTAVEKKSALTFRPMSKQEFVAQTDSPGNRVNKKPFRNLFKGFTILELPGELHVEVDYQNVFLQIRNHDDWKSGLYIDYVRLVNLDDPEQSQESLSNGLHGKRVAAGNEPVDDEGEEYYPSSSSSSSSGPLPWFKQVLGINPDAGIDTQHRFRSRATRQFHPVNPSDLLDVEKGESSAEKSESSAEKSQLSAEKGESPSTARNKSNELEEHRKPVERPDAWYRLLTFLFIYCLYICFWK